MAGESFVERSSGILLHPTSLPGPHGVGDMGPAAYQFVDFLRRAGQRWWQMLPVGPPGGGNSPYDSPSAFAGSPLLISLELLVRDGLLKRSDITPGRQLATARTARYDAAREFRIARLRQALEAVPAAELGTKGLSDMRLRLAAPLNNQKLRIRWASDYLDPEIRRPQVEPAGLEPATSELQIRCSPS